MPNIFRTTRGDRLAIGEFTQFFAFCGSIHCKTRYVTNTADFPHDDFSDDFSKEFDQPAGWLSSEEIAAARAQLPIIYVDAVPVRVDSSGDVIQVGVLLRATESGHMTRALVSGRVLYHERIRDALLRHIEKDLGQMAFPMIPASPQPFTVAEYFPTPGITSYYDPRQHAISMAYVVPVRGECAPQHNALDLAWVTPEEALNPAFLAQMQGGQDILLRQALAHVGRLS